MMSGNFAEMTTSTPFRDISHAANLRHGTDGFTSPPKEGVLKIFFALKNPTASAGFEPANLGTKGQHATPRPPKPLYYIYILVKIHVKFTLEEATKAQRESRDIALLFL